MDWNKTNTILIIAFLVVNLILFGFLYLGKFQSDKLDSSENMDLLHSIEDILLTKNITIKCDVPANKITEPFLQIEYKTINADENIIKNFLGEYTDKISSDVQIYTKNDETLRIVGGKKIIYSKEQPDNIQINIEGNVDNIIKEFCANKNISMDQYVKSCIYEEGTYRVVKLVQQYKGFNLENGYMKFYIAGDNVYHFEQQIVENISERAKVDIVHADEALLRLMVYDDIKDCEVTGLQLCYYTIENADFDNINLINVDLVWRAEINNNEVVYLNSLDY